MITFLGYVIETLSSFIDINPDTVRLLRMLRILRILRALRLIRAFKGLQMIMRTLILSGSACANLVAMLMLVFFMFWVVLVNWFGTMCVAGDEAREGLRGVICQFTPEDNLLDRHAHFQGVGIAIYTLFRIATGDDWGSLMDATTLQPPRNLGWGVNVKPREPIPTEVWTKYDSLLVPPANHTVDDTQALDIAVEALRKWYSIVQGREEEDGWPTPNDDGAEYLQLARLALPNCLTDDEAMYLQRHGVADCSVPGDYHSSGTLDCTSTCGWTPFVVYPAFYLFYAVAAFVLFQLVIGVLMDTYLRVQSEASAHPICPGCDYVTIIVLKRIQKRWLMHARAKAGVHPAILARHKSIKPSMGKNRVAPAPIVNAGAAGGKGGNR